MRLSLLIPVCSFLLLFSNLKAQVHYDLTFYGSHFRYHFVTNKAFSSPKNKGKDSIVNLILKDSNNWDSLVVQHLIKEKIDSANFFILDSTGYYLKVSSYFIIFIHNNKTKYFSSHEAKISTKAIGIINKLKPGDKIIFRSIIAVKRDGYANSLKPFLVFFNE